MLNINNIPYLPYLGYLNKMPFWNPDTGKYEQGWQAATSDQIYQMQKDAEKRFVVISKFGRKSPNLEYNKMDVNNSGPGYEFDANYGNAFSKQSGFRAF